MCSVMTTSLKTACVRASSRRVSGLQPSEAHVLDLQILFDAVFRAFAAQTGLFDAAERRLWGGQQTLVDADDPDLQRLRHPPDLTHILRVAVTWRRDREGGQQQQPFSQ